MKTELPPPAAVQILLLRQRMAQQREIIQQRLTAQTPQNNDLFPRSFVMRLLQQQLAGSASWLMTLQNKLHGKESALLWSVALTLGQHWLQKQANASQQQEQNEAAEQPK